MRVAIIGAGIAGLSCADGLRRTGVDVVVFEKSRGIGGRIATRRTPEELTFDHGAQFFTVQSKAFRQFLAGSAKKWKAVGSFDQSRDWFIGSPDIKSFLRPVARALNLQLQMTVNGIRRVGDHWCLSTVNKDGQAKEHLGFDYVVVSAPGPQTLALTKSSSKLQSEIPVAQMSPCWTIMLAFIDPVEKDFDVKKFDSGSLDWMARNSSKWGRKETPDCWVVHSRDRWSIENLEINRDEILKLQLPEILPHLGKKEDDLLYFSAHRWRYANVERSLGKDFLSDETGTLFAIGDWCRGSCVEDAFISGNALARYMGEKRIKAA